MIILQALGRHMAPCARCGAEDIVPGGDETPYCEACVQTFAKLREHGVWVRYRTDIAGGTLPAGYYVRSDPYGDRYAHSPVDALATATQILDSHGLDGVFDPPEADTHWLIREYLAAHPDIADEVETARDPFFSRLDNW